MKKTLMTLALAATLGLTACHTQTDKSTTVKASTHFVIKAGQEKQIEDLLAKMTLEEKVGQMAQVTLDVLTKGANEFVSDEPVELDIKLLEKAFQKYKIGSVLNTANNRARTPEKWNQLIQQLQKASMEATGIPMLMG